MDPKFILPNWQSGMENQVSLNPETVGGLNELNGLKGPLLGLKLTSSRFLSSLRPKSIFSGGLKYTCRVGASRKRASWSG